MNKQYLVQIEFRYNKNISDGDTQYKRDTVTIGVYDDDILAYIAGNKALEVLESKFPPNPNYTHKPRFSHSGGCFGEPVHLITNLGYLITPFSFFAKIEVLSYEPLDTKIDNILQPL